MAKQKDIFIISQGGLNPAYNRWAQEAVSEFMDMFPEYKEDYPITDIGNWSGSRKMASHAEYMRAPENLRSLYIPTTSGDFLAPFESVDWSMAMAKMSAIAKGHPNQINAGMLLDLMDHDPTVRQIPQLNINLVNEDAFAGTDNNSFVYGLGRPDRGFVLSVYRYEQMYGDNPEYLKEVIKTIAMHELGHVFAATRQGRHNVSNRDGYGQHCDCPGCIMRTDSKAKSNELTNDRLERKRQGLPPLCPECIAMARCHFAELSGNQEQLRQEATKFNMISRRASTYS